MKNWQSRDISVQRPPSEWVDKLSVSPFLLDILWNRGYRSLEEIRQYLDSSLKSLIPPAKWPKISETAQLLVNSLIAGKKTGVWGDYDVDGITATALVLDVLEFHGFSVLHYLPDRRTEGYGLNIPAIERLHSLGCQTLLTVDCGISDVEPIRRANELGMTVIVSDHHLPPTDLPPAAAIVDPRMEVGENWPCEFLAGVGVAFYLMARVNQLLEPYTAKKYRMDQALDLVALGTLADIMPLKGENRVLAKGGLAVLGKSIRPGTAALKCISGLELYGSVNSGQAIFRLAPRINAAGRMGDPELALKLLRAKDYQTAEILASELDACNSLRKNEEDHIHQQARKQALELLDEKNYAALVLYGADWHPGIIGIVASRIVEEFHRPAIVLCNDNEFLKGSGRSWADYDLYSGLEACSDHLSSFGGHKMAAGLRMKAGNLHSFREAFSEHVRSVLGIFPVPPVLKIESELPFEIAAKHSFLEELSLMQPFGPGNPEPVFASRPLLLKKRSPLGRGGEHVLLELEEIETGKRMTAKAWRMAREIPENMVGAKIVIAYTPRLDMYNGFPAIDLGIRDWQKI